MKLVGSVAMGAVLSAAACAGATVALLDLKGNGRDPFASAARARVVLFVRTDCPITNRYAPELQRLARQFAGQGAEFWLVYPDPSQTVQGIEEQIAQYFSPSKVFPGKPDRDGRPPYCISETAGRPRCPAVIQGVLRDPGHKLVKRARATVAPEAAVFDAAGRLTYHGRIDDRWIDAGKARPAPRTHELQDAITATLAGKPVAVPETRAVGCFLADVE